MIDNILNALSSDWIDGTLFSKKLGIPRSNFYFFINSNKDNEFCNAINSLISQKQIEIMIKKSKKGNRQFYFLRKIK